MAVPVITPTKTVHVYGELPLPHYTADQAVVWVTGSGVLLTSVSPRVIYNGTDFRVTIWLEPANQTRLVTVRGGNSLGEATDVALQVYTAFLISPDWGYKQIVDEPAVVSQAEDGVTFKVRYKGDPVVGYEFTLSDRSLIDWEEFEAMRAHLRLHLPFFFTDPETGVTHKLRWDQKRFETVRNFDSNSWNGLARKYSGPL